MRFNFEVKASRSSSAVEDCNYSENSDDNRNINIDIDIDIDIDRNVNISSDTSVGLDDEYCFDSHGNDQDQSMDMSESFSSRIAGRLSLSSIRSDNS
jgi:hypothetical protein